MAAETPSISGTWRQWKEGEEKEGVKSKCEIVKE